MGSFPLSLLCLCTLALPVTSGAVSISSASPLICIDPGHPSETSRGTMGPNGISENHVNWLIACRLSTRLRSRGYRVVSTKEEEDQVVTNRQRAAIANQHDAALFLRLHCDAGTSSGFRIFYPDQQGTRFAVTGPSKTVLERSKAAAGHFHTAMAREIAGAIPDLGVAGDSATYVGKKQGALTGSIFSACPVLTVEMCVLTNAHDERFIISPRGQRLMVHALEAGVIAHLTGLELNAR